MSYEPSELYLLREWDEDYLPGAGSPLRARIYQPVGAGPFPSIVEVHGGDWVSQDRRADVYPCRQLAQSGIVVIAFDFRQAPGTKYPAALQDINFAVRWTKANAKRLQIIPEQVGGLGFSSGAQMITLTALRPLDTLFSAIPLPGAKDSEASLAFVLALDPVFDATARYEYVAKQPVIAAWVDDSEYPRLHKPVTRASGLWKALRGLPLPGWFAERMRRRLMLGLVKAFEDFFPAYEAMADASPLSVLYAGGAQRYPPIFAAQATDDPTLLMESTLSFVSAYLRVGARVELKTVGDAGHGFARRPGHQTDACIADMKSFLHGVLLRAGQNADPE